MCGRFTLTVKAEKTADFFGLAEVPVLPPRYNIAPTQPVMVITTSDQGRLASLYRWGLIPSWATDLAIGNRLINARADTVATKPAFRSAFKQRRCLVIADGFFEWKGAGKKKQPYYFHLRDGRPFAFAGLWERWQKGDEQEILSCALITTEANDVVRNVHDRMPVILPSAAYDQWLSPGVPDPAAFRSLLLPYSADEMTATAVGLQVNNPRFDDPTCIKPLSPLGAP
jgi:putative SOS response-associated peptidase YedK